MPLVRPIKDEDLVFLLKEGKGSYSVLSADDAISSKGDPMIKLLLECYDSDNNKSNIFDYLVFNENIFNQSKIKHFCYSAGMKELYESGEFDLTPDHCINKSGFLKIGIQIDKTGERPKRSCVRYYITEDKTENISLRNNSIDDELPW